ncbi:MAG: hypothetical protein ACP5M4_12710 [Acidobacteriaceae bacterium]
MDPDASDRSLPVTLKVVERDLDAVSAAAVNASGHATPIPLHGRTLHWTAPAGSDWTLLTANLEFRTAPTRSDTNPRNVKDTEQSVEDYMNPAATAAYIRVTHDQYKKYVGNEFGKTIMGFRGDEPDVDFRCDIVCRSLCSCRYGELQASTSREPASGLTQRRCFDTLPPPLPPFARSKQSDARLAARLSTHRDYFASDAYGFNSPTRLAPR